MHKHRLTIQPQAQRLQPRSSGQTSLHPPASGILCEAAGSHAALEEGMQSLSTRGQGMEVCVSGCADLQYSVHSIVDVSSGDDGAIPPDSFQGSFVHDIRQLSTCVPFQTSHACNQHGLYENLGCSGCRPCAQCTCSRQAFLVHTV